MTDGKVEFYKERATRFHRRAQKAEAEAELSEMGAEVWFGLWKAVVSNRSTIKRRLNRVRGQLRDLKTSNLSNIERIIAIGRQFP